MSAAVFWAVIAVTGVLLTLFGASPLVIFLGLVLAVWGLAALGIGLARRRHT